MTTQQQMTPPLQSERETYFPPSESEGGWRWLDTPGDVRSHAGMDTDKLQQAFELQAYLFGSYAAGIVIIRNGYLVREHHTFMSLANSRFDIWSCTKSLTGTAWGLLLDDFQQGRPLSDQIPHGTTIDLDTPAYSLIPDTLPLTDARKEAITIRHLLTMTSGIAGEPQGIYGLPTKTGDGPFEHALGHCPNRFGKSVAQLVAEPGTTWNYSDPAIAHLPLMFAQTAGQQMRDYMQDRIFNPIGIEQASWDTVAGDDSIGPFTSPHIGLHISAREFARFGYLLLRQGRWADKQLIPQTWLKMATKSSQELNPEYGYTFWVNNRGTRWPGLPNDMFAMEGYNSNRCYVIPSLDLVVARVGSGPPRWNEPDFISQIVAASD